MQLTALAVLLQKFDDVFQAPTKSPVIHVKHQIDLIDLIYPDQPIPCFYTYHISSAELDELKCQIDCLLAKRWISPSTTPYGHPVLFAYKKCGALFLCIAFLALNANLHWDCYLLPCINKLLGSLASSNIFTSLDL